MQMDEKQIDGSSETQGLFGFLVKALWQSGWMGRFAEVSIHS